MKSLEKPVKEIKVCCIGSSGAGKTCLMLRFVEQRFDSHTVTTMGASYLCKTLEFDDYNLKLNIWDTVGQERFRCLTRHYYRGAAVAIVVYDITSEQQFDETKTWISDLNKHAPDVVVVAIVGNKKDKEEERQVSLVMGQEYAESIGAIFFETSALTGYHVDLLFDEIAKKLPSDIIPSCNENAFKLLDKPPKKSNCCR